MKKIYSIQIHTKPKKKVHTYWFTDEEKANSFIESVIKDPTVLDYVMIIMEADVYEKYEDGIEDPQVFMGITNRY